MYIGGAVNYPTLLLAKVTFASDLVQECIKIIPRNVVHAILLDFNNI